ncbi:MAG TPA: glycosyltransferase family 87 protein [Polyangia bacterium]
MSAEPTSSATETRVGDGGAAPSFVRKACLALHGLLGLLFLYRLADIARRAEVLATDFVVFFTGWSLIVRGQGSTLYDVEAQRRMQQAIVHPFAFRDGLIAFLTPPHAALLLSPLGALDVQVAFYVWTAVQLGLLIVLARGLLRLCAVEDPLDRALVVMATLAFWPTFYTLYIGQLSILLALAFMQTFNALAAGHPRRAACWLVVLSFKPQLLPFPLLLLLAWRQYGVLLWTTLFGLMAVGVSSLFLGVTIWAKYLHHLGQLEAFFGDGVPRFMMNVRGAVACLAAMAGGDGDRVATGVAWLAFAGALPLAYVLWRRAARVVRGPVGRKTGAGAFDLPFAQATALALFFSPHLFMQDTLSWVVPLALFYRRQGRSAAVARFALCWPTVFAISVVVDNADPRRAIFNGALALIVALVGWLLWASRLVGAARV